MAELASCRRCLRLGGAVVEVTSEAAATSTRLACMCVDRGRRGFRRADGHRHSTAAARAPVRPDREREARSRGSKNTPELHGSFS